MPRVSATHLPGRRPNRLPNALLLSLGLFGAQVGAQDNGWDVTDTGQPSTTQSFSVNKGTWMSLTVSPGGETIAFDLLGDIYRMPASGGKADLVHGGKAMQRSPRFSPNGERLLYISDASGSDNVWVSQTDGSSPRQITEGTRNMFTSPAWGAAGRYIAAEQFTTTFPKLRASEIRMFHLAGGHGRILVPTPNNGRDVAEANFGPNGRYMYYTEKVTDPNIFVDANHINHVIKRRNLHTGKVEKVVGGFGGAVAPQISPDGKRLAFVRRVKDKTVLFVYNTETQKQQPIYSDLDRDLQADFVPHGNYYPSYDWFPDNRHIAIWGKGELYKIDVVDRKAEKIPFEVTATHRYTKSPRFGQDLAPDQVTVRAMRHPAVAPNGETLTFHAIGHLWQQQLPSGNPVRLTDAKAFEFEPAYSPSGKRLAYVEWKDARGSALKVITLASGQTRTVAHSPGVIRAPRFSPDGQRLVYRIEDGNKIMGGYQAQGGLYLLNLDEPKPQHVQDSGREPQFGPDGERIYYTHTDSSGGIYSDNAQVTKLQSVNLRGNDQRTHAQGPHLAEVHLSPNHRWIVFKQFQQYYAVPYRETGRPLELGSNRAEVPVTPLTRASGFGLTWSGTNGSAYWMLGPKLFRADVSERAAAATSVPEAYTTIDLAVPADKPKGQLAFVHGRVITMDGDEVIGDGAVVVKRNRITAVGPTNEITVPDNAKVIDVSGKTVMPGLIDMHGHIDCCFDDSLMPQKQPSRYAALAFGVTTNLDQYSSRLSNYESTEMTRAGMIVGPRFIGSGAVIYGRKYKTDYTYDPIKKYADARQIMRRKNLLGGTLIKSYKQPTRRQRQMLVKAGRTAGINIDGEGGNHFYNNITMVLDGHTILEHNLPVANYYEDIIKFMAHGDTANTPTLNAVFGEIMGENYLYQTTDPWKKSKIKTYVQQVVSHYSPMDVLAGAPPHVRDMTTLHASDKLYDIGFRSVSRSIDKLNDAGVTINVGSHGQIPGLSMHWEMWLFEEGGMSSHDILRAATINGAKSLSLADQIGSLEAGKLADLIVLDKNPLNDIRNSDSVRYTMIGGRLYNARSMDEIGNYDRPRSRFYWEMPNYGDSSWNPAWSDR